MTHYIVSFLLISFTMSIIALLVISLNALSLKWLNARLRYALWLVILVGLLIPFRPSIGSGFIPVPFSSFGQGEVGVFQNVIHGEFLIEEEFAQNTTSAGQSLSTAGLASSPLTIFVSVWSAVAIAVFAFHILQYIRFTRLLRHWGKPINDTPTLEIFQSIKKNYGLKDIGIGLMQCNFITTSMLTGFLKPIILLPEKHFEADELDMIFRHELIHYRRKDLYVKLLSVIAISIHWFNPIIYWMCGAIQTESEAACDEAVLQDIGEENRRYYAELIIEMIGHKKTTLLSTCFYGGKKSLKRRLDSIMDTTKKMKKTAYATFLAIVMVTIMSGSVFAFSAQEFYDENTLAIEFTEYDIEPMRAREIALTTVGGGTIVSTVLNEGVYAVEVLYGDKRYEVDISAIDGSILSYLPIAIEEAVNPNLQVFEDSPLSEEIAAIQSGNLIVGQMTIEEIAKIAVDAVGGGKVEKVEYEYKNGQSIFEVKVRDNNRIKYEVKVDGETGEIIRLKKD